MTRFAEDVFIHDLSVDGRDWHLSVLDTAGQEEYCALRDQWFRDGEAFLLLYSVTSRSSLEDLADAAKHVQRATDLELDSLPIV